MTVQKSFKRLVRARMAKTGESYTAARAQLLAGVDDGSPADDQMPRLACSDERIRERTGKGWEEWFALLDTWDAESMDHTALARRVGKHLGDELLSWNAQAVTTSFERARGKRAVGERVGGDGFTAGASKTIAASATDVFAAFIDPSRRAGWLPNVHLSERTVAKQKRTARYDVGDGTTRLVVAVESKGRGKSTVWVEESRLSGTAERDARKAFWRDAVASLQAEVEQEA